MKPKKYLSWHSHIKNLNVQPIDSSKNFYTKQFNVRKISSVIINLVKKNKLDGKVILLTGPIGSGKTALALGIASKLGEKIPFCMIHGAEISSPIFKKTNILLEKCRRAIGLKLFQKYEFYEGEIMETNFILKKENSVSSPPSVILSLRTTEECLKIKLFDSLYEKFISKKLKKGDIVKIEPKNNLVRRVGKSLDLFTGQIEEGERFLSTPIGKVFKKKLIVKEISLYDLDFLNFQNLTKQNLEEGEKTDQLYNEINLLVSNYIREKKAEITSGILFIDEAHFLDYESFCFLTKILDSSFPPIIILATNRTICLRSHILSKLGVPNEFLTRCLTVKTKNHNQKEISAIISLKSKENRNFLSGNSFLELCIIAKKNSLRFSILLGNFSYSLKSIFYLETINIIAVKIIFFFFFHLRESGKILDFIYPALTVFKTF
mmetsp:Transcript_47056/g.94223  ORF Transcript_47056/g.94223 Transcript_47056/m.94223 type:complete len:434 (+) Transcript_47056:16-1317(+)